VAGGENPKDFPPSRSRFGGARLAIFCLQKVVILFLLKNKTYITL